MQFASDNRAGVTPEVLDAIAAEAAADGGAYGLDDTTDRLAAAFAEVFEHDVEVFPVLTGTAANSLALAGLCEPWGSVICHREAHVLVDEGGAPELYGNGLRLLPLPDLPGDEPAERIEPTALAAFLEGVAAGRNDVHQVLPQALSLTNLSELGRTYSAPETAAVAGVARSAGLRVHLDGARFANAVVGTGDSPADLTWRAGVDVVSFGGTKNGALAAEAVVYFEPTLAAGFERRRKRGGHLLSKMRFVSAQLLAQLAGGAWLERAAHANAAAARLARGLAAVDGVRLVSGGEGNEVFVALARAEAERWLGAGLRAYVEPAAGDSVTIRLVTSWSTTDAEVEQLLAVAAGADGEGKA